jgi:hypothetical protein
VKWRNYRGDGNRRGGSRAGRRPSDKRGSGYPVVGGEKLKNDKDIEGEKPWKKEKSFQL